MAERRKARGATPLAPRFQPEEYVRIVPLHRAEIAAPAPKGNFTYRGGALLTSVQVFTIFWGAQWGGNASVKPMAGRINQFFADILASPLIDQLAEYSVPGKTIGHGTYVGTTTIVDGAPAKTVTDSQVRKQLAKWIAAGTVPKKTRNSLYFVYLDPNVTSVMGGSRSCQNYCGYHNNSGTLYYAVMPYPSCTGCLAGLSAFDALTGTSSHELCEAITDPVPGKGWYDDNNGEIGDICAWSFKKVAGYNVQVEWSQKQGKCV
jgi:hypothetical protein